ncbi:hypothetical protein BDV98DRAFT_180639 [Pterulicium gracile]|uniref:Uncharacterized protein n=1 Tax=Pterulicium gracile TaxID=1884261 RepID=A0A5C3QFY9_9AGAR|nr:hypothetical protein BDV98DRAFT_180639 [Pterula gracilis]
MTECILRACALKFRQMCDDRESGSIVLPVRGKFVPRSYSNLQRHIIRLWTACEKPHAGQLSSSFPYTCNTKTYICPGELSRLLPCYHPILEVHPTHLETMSRGMHEQSPTVSRISDASEKHCRRLSTSVTVICVPHGVQDDTKSTGSLHSDSTSPQLSSLGRSASIGAE